MDDLKPCPFCGGEAVVEQQGSPRQSSIIACEGCGCLMETGETWNIGSHWNTRSGDLITRAEANAMVREALEIVDKECQTQYENHVALALVGDPDNASEREIAASTAERLQIKIRALIAKYGETG